MRVELDISPHFGQRADLFLGMGGPIEDCIRLSRKEYKKTFHETSLREYQRGRRKPTTARSLKLQQIRVYSIFCFLLVEPHLKKITHIDIDRDFIGHKARIADKLGSLIDKAGFSRYNFEINAEAIAGKGRAHIVANECRTGKRQYRDISATNILQYY